MEKFVIRVSSLGGIFIEEDGNHEAARLGAPQILAAAENAGVRSQAGNSPEVLRRGHLGRRIHDHGNPVPGGDSDGGFEGEGSFCDPSSGRHEKIEYRRRIVRDGVFQVVFRGGKNHVGESDLRHTAVQKAEGPVVGVAVSPVDDDFAF